MNTHTPEMLALLEEHTFNTDLCQCYVYGSLLRPVSNVWARSIHPQAVSFPADKLAIGCHSSIAVPVLLTADVLEHFDLVLISIPVDAYEQLLDRRAFFSVMRSPSLRVLRLALKSLRDDAGMDWREVIQEAEIVLLTTTYGWWQFITDKYSMATMDSESPTLSFEDFVVVREDETGCQNEPEQLDAEQQTNLAAYVESTSALLEALTAQSGPIQAEYCWMHNPGGWCCERCAASQREVNA